MFDRRTQFAPGQWDFAGVPESEGKSEPPAERRGEVDPMSRDGMQAQIAELQRFEQRLENRP